MSGDHGGQAADTPLPFQRSNNLSLSQHDLLHNNTCQIHPLKQAGDAVKNLNL